MIHSSITFNIKPTDVTNPIGAEVWLDDRCVYNQDQCTESTNVCVEFDDDTEQTHFLKIVVKNKTADHTKIDSQGNIVADSAICIENFLLDDVEISTVVSELAVYRHDFNGTGNWVDEKFYGYVGCNGSITLEFTAPAYLWLLENM